MNRAIEMEKQTLHTKKDNLTDRTRFINKNGDTIVVGEFNPSIASETVDNSPNLSLNELEIVTFPVMEEPKEPRRTDATSPVCCQRGQPKTKSGCSATKKGCHPTQTGCPKR